MVGGGGTVTASSRRLAAATAAAATAAAAALTAAALLTGILTAVPAQARTDGDPALVTDEQIAASIQSLDVGDAVIPIEIDNSLVELRTEQRSGAGVAVAISADVLFDFDSAGLTDEARTELGRIGAELAGATGTVSVDGHTDDVGDPAYNLTLSQDRADAVADLLRPVVPAGVSVTALGHGSMRPIADNSLPNGTDNPDGRALNRRVTVTYQLS